MAFQDAQDVTAYSQTITKVIDRLWPTILAQMSTNDSFFSQSLAQKQTSISPSSTSGSNQDYCLNCGHDQDIHVGSECSYIDNEGLCFCVDKPKKMKALLYRLDGKIKEFEVRGPTPCFVLVEPVVGWGEAVIERQFRLANDPLSNGVGFYVEDGVKPEYFKLREEDARQRHNHQYAEEMKWMAERIARPDFSGPVVGKPERYADWDPGIPLPTAAPAKPIQHDPFVVSAPFQVSYKDNANELFSTFSNITYAQESTPPPAYFKLRTEAARLPPPPQGPEVIGEPKKRLILIQKETNHEDVASVVAPGSDSQASSKA